MKRTAAIVALTIFSMALLLPLAMNLQAASAQTSGYTIDKVDHTVDILYSGHVVISDTFQLSGTLPSTFLVGMPFKYSTYILKGIAYDSNYNSLPLALGVQLQSQSGFYAARVSLPSGTSNKFTVVFILSDTATTSVPTGYNVDFPAYPALTQTTGDCNVTLILPSSSVSVTGIDKSDGAVNATFYDKQNLPAFTYSPGIARLGVSFGYLQQVIIPTLSRQVGVSSSGAVTVTDTYHVINNSTSSISSFLFNLPLNANGIVARDQFGRILTTALYQSNNIVYVQNVTLAVAMGPGEATDVSLDYSLPSISAQGARFVLNLDLLPYFNYYIDSASVTVTPPEGANIVTPQFSQVGSTATVSRNAFQQSVTFNRDGVSYVDSTIPSQDQVSVAFDYSSLWIAFRPTSWAWAVVAVGMVVVALWLRPKAKAVAAKRPTVVLAPGMTLSAERIREFADAFEEKMKITTELSTLEARVAHGRIPRRRYKVQRMAMEQRLESLTNHMAQLKELMRKAGGNFGDLVRQVEAAEVELEEVQLALKSLEVRHESGEITGDVYRKQLTDLERRKEKAETRISELVLRVRGEAQA